MVECTTTGNLRDCFVNASDRPACQTTSFHKNLPCNRTSLSLYFYICRAVQEPAGMNPWHHPHTSLCSGLELC